MARGIQSGLVAMNEVTDDVERAPGIAPFIRGQPGDWQATKQRIERGRCSSENANRVLQQEGTARTD